MVNPEVLRKRLQKMAEYLGILDHARAYSLEEFTANPERYGSAERFLQLAIEALNDMGNHIIADNELGVVNRSSDIPRILAQKNGLDNELCELWIKMIGFRNILVHDYLDVDRGIVHEVLQQYLGDLQSIQRYLSRFL